MPCTEKHLVNELVGNFVHLAAPEAILVICLPVLYVTINKTNGSFYPLLDAKFKSVSPGLLPPPTTKEHRKNMKNQ